MRRGVVWAFLAMSFGVAAGQEALAASTPIDTLVIGDLQRTFGLYVPDKLAERPALVLAFHGSGGNAAVPPIFGFEPLADAEGFILAYPNGFEGHWNDCRSAGSYAANAQNIDDVEFVRRLVAELAKRYGVESTRVFATGWSNGGQFVYRLAMECPGLVAAVAPFGANLPADTNLDCTPSGQPVSVMIVNGTKDSISPWEGGSSPHGEVRSAEQTFAYWAEVAGLRGQPTVTLYPDVVADDESTVERRTLSAGRIEVSLVIVHGGGHTLPGASMKAGGRLGAVNRDVVGAELIWKFFARHLVP